MTASLKSERAHGLPLIEEWPTVAGTEVCCGHCAQLRPYGAMTRRRKPFAPAEHSHRPGLLSVGTLYACAGGHDGPVSADNVCASFVRRPA